MWLQALGSYDLWPSERLAAIVPTLLQCPAIGVHNQPSPGNLESFALCFLFFDAWAVTLASGK